MTGRVVTFTNLFPSSRRPAHGVFVRERMRRVVERLACDWRVLCPVPAVPWPLRGGAWARFRELPDREVHDGVEVLHPRYFHLPGVSTAAHARRMTEGARAALRDACERRPCLIDAHYVYPDGVAALALGREFDVPVFVTARGSDLNVLAAMPAVERQIRAALPHAAGLFAVSEPLRRRLGELAGDPARAVLVRNGVDLERFRPGDRGAARRALGLPEQVALVGGVGRLVEGKGFHLAVRALRRLPSAVHLALLGDGPERERLATLAPEGRLHLLGARPPDTVPLFYQAIDLLVLPSQREGWPNVVTEALAAGVRVVATPVGAIPEILSAPHVGSLVRPEPTPIARELERWLDAPPDPDGVRRFARQFSWDGPVDTIVQRYREILEPRA